MREILDRIEDAAWAHLGKTDVNHVGEILARLEILQMCGVIRAQLSLRQVKEDTEALAQARMENRNR